MAWSLERGRVNITETSGAKSGSEVTMISGEITTDKGGVQVTQEAIRLHQLQNIMVIIILIFSKIMVE